jgi:hypothetical protein
MVVSAQNGWLDLVFNVIGHAQSLRCSRAVSPTRTSGAIDREPGIVGPVRAGRRPVVYSYR